MQQITISVDKNAICQLIDTAHSELENMEADGDFDQKYHDFLDECVAQVEAAVINAIK